MSEQHIPRRGGRVRGAEGYHREDVLALLKCVRNVVPVAPEDWDLVLDEYRQTHATPNTRAQRDSNSLKVKFKQLARSYKPDVEGRLELQEASNVMDLIASKMADGKSLQRRGGRARGAEGFSAADSQTILTIVRRFLPVGRSDWEQVAEEYCREYAVPNDRISRDGTSLKNKFRNWLKGDNDAMSRSEVGEAVAIQAEINTKTGEIAKTVTSLEHERVANYSAEDVDERRVNEPEAAVLPTTTGEANGYDQSATSSENEDKTPVTERRRGGRAVGSEGYTKSDTRALLECVRQVLPWGPTSWEHVLQLYRVNYAIPNNRAQRYPSGIKIKFRQLVNWRQDHKPVPEEVLEARSIQTEIDLHDSQEKRPRSESDSNVSSPHTPEAKTSKTGDEQPVALPHIETRNKENVEQQNVASESTAWPTSSPQSLGIEHIVKRRKHDRVADQRSPNSESMRKEIASRELELLQQREQREAEQAEWEKERVLREKQRMDMEDWTSVCDRLRALYREKASETTIEIINEIEEEIAVLKKKQQRLASLLG
ncbi:hypothetical protein P3T76_008680 [Phytophthora citrophthora]|uniref:Uncharacterized protein n=1 Tax=Phytophthora citrophthora TaxID=4793 RepID=A0AAD9GIU3_9STRA|nr:hypothetical protein P3T76_008680 [Phytophthora citrophthora]